MKFLGIEIGEERRGGDGPGKLGRLLKRNAALRAAFPDDRAARERLVKLQHWQSKRLLRSHADLRADPRYRIAVEFFFNELYGGGDPQARDRDLQRVDRVMERLLPKEALHALMLAIELEILSQELDADMVRAMPPGRITVEKYAEGYRLAGRRADRERQIELLGAIGKYLDRVVKTPMIRGLVHFARRPAHAAGFGAMQEFLERGLDAFEAMHGADEFLATLREREWRVMERIFDEVADPFEFAPRKRSR